MLILKPNCECCDVDLPPESKNARVCSFECTFCNDCADVKFDGVCPNCGGGFAQRPIRPTKHLEKHPASTVRFNKDHAECVSYASRISK
ncbi:MAG: DUF1272 domain-containing protein [Pseudomonadales bacterium]|jgi:hypothetical protein